MRIVFSKDRPAQLDLLLRSIRKHLPHEATKVIWEYSQPWFVHGYGLIGGLEVTGGSFNDELRGALLACPHETVTFFCDDDVVFRDARAYDITLNEDVLTWSLRLGKQNGWMPWPDASIYEDTAIWTWVGLEPHTFGFPASVDGHTFRVEDIWELIGDDRIDNPTMLETVMAMRVGMFAERRPKMASFQEQKLVSVPVNKVSDQSTCATGRFHPQSTKDLNDRFLGGERIDLDALDFTGCDDVHWEVNYEWGKT